MLVICNTYNSGKKIKVFICGDYEFETQSYGISGASGIIVTGSEKTLHIVQTHIWHNVRFSTTGKKMSKSSFYHIHVRKPFFYPLLSPTEGKPKLPRQNKSHFNLPSLYSCHTQNPLLRALIRIPASRLSGFVKLRSLTF